MLIKPLLKPLLIPFVNKQKIFLFTPEVYLLSSICLETLSTSLLPITKINPIYFIPVYIGYGISFYIFPKCLNKFNLSTAYSIWSGVGIILTTLIDIMIYKSNIHNKKIIGLFFIIFGIFMSK